MGALGAGFRQPLTQHPGPREERCQHRGLEGMLRNGVALPGSGSVQKRWKPKPPTGIRGGLNPAPQTAYDGYNTHVTPPPVIKQGRLYVHFGAHGTACLDTQTAKKLGERRNLKRDHPARGLLPHKMLLPTKRDRLTRNGKPAPKSGHL